MDFVSYDVVSSVAVSLLYDLNIQFHCVSKYFISNVKTFLFIYNHNASRDLWIKFENQPKETSPI